MSRRARRSQRFIILGFMGGLAVAMSCATMEDVLISAKQVLYEDNGATRLNVSNVQAAIEKLKARTEQAVTVDWKDLKNVPSDLADGDNVGTFTAGKGITISGSTIDVKFGSVKDTAAQGDHAHTLTSKDLSDFDTAAKTAMGPEGNTNTYRHQRYNENDVKSSAYVMALEKKIKALEDQNLLTQLGALSTKLGTRPKCPGGYTPQSLPNIMLCKRGMDQMVQVGDYWIDRYEVLLVDAKYFNDGQCDQGAAGAKYGDINDPKYPSDFPANGDWTNASKRLFACSLFDKQPSRFMSWFQASQACAAAGKHLCTNEEWQTAAAGTAKSTCNTKGTILNTGKSSCTSSWGVEDMVGNLSEYVGTLIPGGKSWMAKDEEVTHPYPATFHFGEDVAINVNSRVEIAPMAFKNGMLASPRRGGDRDDDKNAGSFAVDLSKGPAYASNSTGARCCIGGR